MNEARELDRDALWNPCNPAIFDFDTTEALPGDVMIIGQERAVDAITFGVNIQASGFNIYALGSSGTGRTTTIHTLLNEAAASRPIPGDWIYVNNFLDDNRPRAITLPAGMAVQFRRDMEELVSELLREIPQVFESKEYEDHRAKIARQVQEQRDEVFRQLEQQVRDHGFTLLKTSTGFGVAPVINGQVLSPEMYEQLDAATRQQIEGLHEQIQREIADTMRQVRDLDKEAKHRLQALDREVADYAVGHLVADLKERYGPLEEVLDYLAEVQADLVDNVSGFQEREETEDGLAAAVQAGQEDFFQRYRVNVVVDNSRQQGAPVVFEPNPTYGNLLGRIEHRAEMGALDTDFTMIRAGSLHRANGGYLVLEMEGLLANPAAWEALKRSLKNGQIRTEEMGNEMQVVSTVTLEPEPVPLDVKVVLTGDPDTYYWLYEYDPDFGKLFKVQADFGDDFLRTPETGQCYAQFIAARCRQEGLLPFDRQAVARVVEYGSRLAEHQKKLSTRFGEIADLVREASYWAGQAGRQRTTAEDVQTAEDKKIYRAARVEDEIQEMIDDGTVQVDVEGRAVGQVNGLSVLSLGNRSFGRPSRITVSTYTGKEGIVSLNREAKLSGRIYDKGLMTLSGYLGGKYALDAALSLSASISFEQLYEEIEGDSASSAELYALLSSLSGLPIRQGLAVTGSVDQQGNVQPVGGVNEKVEGFFETCQHRGLNGEQGVLLPARNVVHLMLRADVRQAVAEGRFHLYPVETIDQGIEILTGVPAGQRAADGSYPPGSVHGRVLDRLDELANNLQEKDEDEDEGPGSDSEEA